jgi:hypothetical protein
MSQFICPFIMPCPQSKRYCFTIPNKPTVAFSLKLFQAKHCKYSIDHQEREIGPQFPIWDGEAYPTYLHGFFTMKKKLSVTGIHKATALNFTHLAAANGTSIQILRTIRKVTIEGNSATCLIPVNAMIS